MEKCNHEIEYLFDGEFCCKTCREPFTAEHIAEVFNAQKAEVARLKSGGNQQAHGINLVLNLTDAEYQILKSSVKKAAWRYEHNGNSLKDEYGAVIISVINKVNQSFITPPEGN